MNIESVNSVSLYVMKKILMFAVSLLAVPLFSSCTDYGVYGHTGGFNNFGGPGGFNNFGGPVGFNQGFVGGGLAPLQVGFVATSFDRWAYDPFRRAYFDRRVGRFYDPRLRNYCRVAPRRFSTAVYPSGHRRGRALACPPFLPRTDAVARNGGRGVSRNTAGFNQNRGRFAPVVHGVSRGSSSLRGASNGRDYGSYGNSRSSNSRGSLSNRGPVSAPVRGSSGSRQSVRPSSSSRLQTVSAPPSRGQSIRPRPAPVVRSQPTRSSPSVRQSSYSRSSSGSSRSAMPSRSSRSGGSSRSPRMRTR